jgi:hypothetical protein
MPPHRDQPPSLPLSACQLHRYVHGEILLLPVPLHLVTTGSCHRSAVSRGHRAAMAGEVLPPGGLRSCELSDDVRGVV